MATAPACFLSYLLQYLEFHVNFIDLESPRLVKDACEVGMLSRAELQILYQLRFFSLFPATESN